MRAFLGVKISNEIASKILSSVDARSLKESFPPSDFHITITFLENLEDAMLDGYLHALSQLNAEPFDVELDGFSSVKAGRGVIGFCLVKDTSRALGNLKISIDKILKGLGIEPPAREYKPHISLGYLDENFVDEFRSVGYSDTITVENFSLLSSVRELSGGPYVEIHRFYLRNM